MDKNITLEKINKILIFFAILSLLFRVGNFSVNHIPKPFEIIVLVIFILTIIDIIINHRIKEFFYSIPKKILIPLIFVVFSILLGWLTSLIINIPTTFNMFLEFGSFVFSLLIFLLIIFYTKKDYNYNKKYLYALLLPIIYIPFIFFPTIAQKLHVALSNHFIGFTDNPNIVSKILLIPTIFFIIKSLIDYKNNWLNKVFYMLISSLMIVLILWTASRGALLSLILGVVFLWLILFFNKFSWKKVAYNTLTLIVIFILGFIISPRHITSNILNRVQNTKIIDNQYVVVNKNVDVYKTEPRLRIWKFYLNKILVNPLGYGPDTHMQSNILLTDGTYDNTGPHDTYLQIALWGGLIGLVSFMYFIIYIFTQLFNHIKKQITITGLSLLVILFTLLISILFDDSLSFYNLWIILALCLVYIYGKENN